MDDCLTDLAPSPDAIPRWTAADTQAIAGVLASVPADPAVRRSQLAAVEEVLAEGEGSADLRCRRALLLDALGRTEEARQAYLAGLSLTPGHAATLNGLGALLNRTGFRAAARTVFAQAAACHPYLPLGHVNLANVLREDRELAGARRHYEAALLFSPGLPEAHQGLGQMLADLGQHAAADRHWQIGYRDRVFTTWPYRGEGTPVRVLLLASVAGGNVPVRLFLDDRVFETIAVATEYATDEHGLPPHDLVLNSIGDAELCGRALTAAEALLARTSAPVINRPQAVRQTGRMENARRLAELDGVVAPGITLMARDMLAGAVGDLELIDQGFQFPLLLRAPGFHTGQHFLRVERAEHLAAEVRGLPGAQVLAIDCLDAAGADGMFRKGRVLFIDGQMYPLHWAISADWKVHYFTADMAENAAHRAEEARFLTDMPGFIGARAMQGLAAIATRLGLDYGGIDFALSADGEVLVFEANATMAIVPPSPEPIWDYRRAAVGTALAAVRAMLIGRVTTQP
jgi:hypothetical protein